jgi:hypothetical protein
MDESLPLDRIARFDIPNAYQHVLFTSLFGFGDESAAHPKIANATMNHRMGLFQ